MAQLESDRLIRALRTEKAAAFQRQQLATDRKEHRTAAFEAGRVAGLRVALAVVREQAEAVAA